MNAGYLNFTLTSEQGGILVTTDYRETPAEELVNALTHGLGAIAALAGLGRMLELCWDKPLALLACTVFGLTLVMMFASSAVYHACHLEHIKPRLQNIDHVAIYLLIGGSYTPYCLLALPAWPGLPVLAVVWVLAIAGSVFEVKGGLRYPSLSLVLYLGLGWLALLIVPHLLVCLSPAGLGWLLVGGLCYTIGAIFYARHWFLYSHSVWHLFVIAGAGCHFQSVWHVLQGL